MRCVFIVTIKTITITVLFQTTDQTEQFEKEVMNAMHYNCNINVGENKLGLI